MAWASFSDVRELCIRTLSSIFCVGIQIKDSDRYLDSVSDNIDEFCRNVPESKRLGSRHSFLFTTRNPRQAAKICVSVLFQRAFQQRTRTACYALATATSTTMTSPLGSASDECYHLLIPFIHLQNNNNQIVHSFLYNQPSKRKRIPGHSHLPTPHHSLFILVQL